MPPPVRILDEPGADVRPQPIPVARALQLAFDAARAGGGTLSRQTCPPELPGAVLTVEAGDAPTGPVWRWIAWQAGAHGGGIIYRDADGRRLRFRLDCAAARNGGYWYASHYDRRTGRTLNVYVGSHRSGAPEAEGLERGARRIAAKLQQETAGIGG